jgi:hypothetical protein
MPFGYRNAGMAGRKDRASPPGDGPGQTGAAQSLSLQSSRPPVPVGTVFAFKSRKRYSFRDRKAKEGSERRTTVRLPLCKPTKKANQPSPTKLPFMMSNPRA